MSIMTSVVGGLKKFFSWWTFYRLVLVLVLLNIVDAGSTHLAIKVYGPNIELNPLMRWLWIQSPYYFWMIKLTLSVIGLTVIGHFDNDRDGKSPRALIALAVIVYVAVLLGHLQVWALYFRGF